MPKLMSQEQTENSIPKKPEHLDFHHKGLESRELQGLSNDSLGFGPRLAPFLRSELPFSSLYPHTITYTRTLF